MKGKKVDGNDHWRYEREQLFDAIAGNRALIDSLLDTNNDGVTLTSEAGNLLVANNQFKKLIGYSLEQIEGRKLVDFVEPKFKKSFEKNHQRAFEGERVESVEYEFITNSGSVIEASEAIQIINIGSSQYLLSSIKSITEERENQQELNSLYAAINKSSNAIVITDTEGITLYVNDVHESFTGFKREESLGKLVTLFDSNFIEPEVVEEIKQQLNKGKQWKGKYTSQRKSGMFFDIQITVSPVINDDGKTEAFLFYTENIGIEEYIHDRKIKELDLMNTKELLSRTEKIGGIGSFKMNLKTNKIVWSDNIYNLLGMPVSEGPSLRFFHKIIKEDRYVIQLTLDLKSGERASFNFRMDIEGGVKHLYCELERNGEDLTGMLRDVTSEMLSNLALKESEEKYRFQSEALPHILWLVDAQGSLTYLNSRGRSYFGIHDHSFFGAKWLDFVHPDDILLIKTKWKETNRNKTTFSEQVRIKNSTGIYRWFMVSVSPMLDESGNITSLIGISTDVHDQYLIQANLKENEQKFRTIFEQSNDAMVILKDGFCLDCNTNVKAIFGIAEEQLKNEKLWRFTPEYQTNGRLSEEFVAEQIENVLKNGQANFFWDVKKSNSKIIFCEVNLSRIMIDGDVFIFAVFRDVTGRVKAEKELLDSKQKMMLAIESARIGTWELNLKTGKTRFNEYYAEMLGYDFDEIVHEQAFFDERVHPDDLERINTGLYGEAVNASGEFELLIRIKGKDDKWRWVLDRGKIIERDKDGKPLIIYGTHIDFTEYKEKEKAIVNANLKYELAATTAKTGVWEWDMVSDYLVWDKGMASIHERKLPKDNQIKISDWLEYVQPAYKELLTLNLGSLVKNRGVFDVEYEIKTKSGKIKRVRSTAKIFRINEEEGDKIIGLNLDITDSYLKDQELLENEERLKLAFDGANMALMDWDLETNTVSVSDNYLEIIGQEKDRYDPSKDQFMDSVLHPDDSEKVRMLFSKLKVGKLRHYELEYRVLTQNNELRWLRSKGKTFVDTNGRLRVIGLTMNVTATRIAQEQLMESQRVLNLAISGTKQIILDWDIKNDLLEWNENYYELIGRSKYDFENDVTDYVRKSVFAEDVELVCDLATKLKSGEVNEIDVLVRLVTNVGDVKWMRALGKNVEFDKNRLPIRHVCTLMDVTKERKLTLDLEKSYAQYQSLVEDIPGLVYSAKYPSKEFVYVNAYCLELTGFTADELIKIDPLQYQKQIHPDDKRFVESSLNAAISNKQPYRLSYRILDREGKIKWLSEFGHGIFDQNGVPLSIEASVFDITDRIRSEEKVLAAILDAADHERSRISREIHDSLQQTLTIASLNLEFVKKEKHLLSPKVLERYERGWQNLRKSLDQTREIAHRLMPKAIEDFGLTEVVKDLVDELNATSSVNFEFITNLEEERLNVSTETSFYKIIQESITNIIKHAQAESVSIQLLKLSESIQLIIEDDGQGFDMDNINFNSSGFGLASMKNRASALSGEFILDSFPGKGTSLILNVPLDNSKIAYEND
ncbi:PAS domain-containing protein [Roseivirga seohaensis]|nr:PAS domain-containing protein [Roseivirga seohaensis]